MATVQHVSRDVEHHHTDNDNFDNDNTDSDINTLTNNMNDNTNNSTSSFRQHFVAKKCNSLIDITINKVSCVALVDTGSDVSLINKNFVRVHNIPTVDKIPELCLKKGQLVRGLQGRCGHIDACAQCVLSFPKHLARQLQVNMVITDFDASFPFSVVLGREWLAQNDIWYHAASNQLRLRDGTLVDGQRGELQDKYNFSRIDFGGTQHSEGVTAPHTQNSAQTTLAAAASTSTVVNHEEVVSVLAQQRIFERLAFSQDGLTTERIDEIIPPPHEYEEKIQSLKQQYSDVFATQLKSFDEIMSRPDNNLLTFDVPWDPDVKLPPPKPAFRLPPEQKAAVDDFISTMLKLGLIVKLPPTESPPYVARIFCVRKPVPPEKLHTPAAWRPVVDLRAQNTAMRREVVCGHTFETVRAKLAHAKWLSKFDLCKSFHQIAVTERSRKYLAFGTEDAVYAYAVAPMGAACSPSFQAQFLRHILQPLADFAIPVHDDIVLFSNGDPDHHLQLVQKFLDQCRRYRVVVNPDKAMFLADHIPFLGFSVSPQRVRITADRVNALDKLGYPTTAKQCGSIAGFFAYFAHFIPAFSELVHPLRTGATRGKQFVLDNDCKQAVDNLRRALMQATMLAVPDPDREFLAFTDASGHALGGVLAQRTPEGHLRPLFFYSRNFSKAEARMSTTARELIALADCLKRFVKVAGCNAITCFVDHRPLLAWQTAGIGLIQSARLGRMLDQMAQLALKVVYVAGEDNVADVVSRMHEFEHTSSSPSVEFLEGQLVDDCLEDRADELLIAADKIDDNVDIISLCKHHYQEDTFCSSMISKLQQPKPPAESRRFRLVNDVLYYDDSARGLSEGTRLVLPKVVRTLALNDAHGSSTAAHQGVTSTMYSLRQRFFWPHMEADTRRFIRRCTVCAATKRPVTPRATGTLAVPNARNEVVHCDILSGLLATKAKHPLTGKAYESLLIFTCRLTGFSVLAPVTKDFTSEDFADEFLRCVQLQYPCRVLFTDSASVFTSKFINRTMEILKVKLVHPPYYTPQANIVERVNSIVLSRLRALLQDKPTSTGQPQPESQRSSTASTPALLPQRT